MSKAKLPCPLCGEKVTGITKLSCGHTLPMPKLRLSVTNRRLATNPRIKKWLEDVEERILEEMRREDNDPLQK